MSDNPPASISRRALFKSGGAAAVAAATGADIATEAQVSHISNASITLLKFSHQLREIRSAMMGRSLETDEGIAVRIAECLKGKPNWGIKSGDEHLRHRINTNRIDFNDEKKIWHALKRLPQDEPLMDMLSEASLERVHGKEDPDDYMSEHKDIRQLRDFLKPVCNSATTSADLLEEFKGFFEALAQEAIKNPQKFRSKQESKNADSPQSFRVSSDIRRLEEIFEDDETQSGLIEELKQARARHVELEQKEYFDLFENDRLEKDRELQERLAENAKREEQERREYEEEYQAQKDNPALRYEYEVRLASLIGKRFIVDSPEDRELDNIPARVDWLQWLQKEVDPMASSRDFELPEMDMGRLIIFSDTDIGEKAMSIIKQEEGYVSLPNRRSNVDLNQHIKPISYDAG